MANHSRRRNVRLAMFQERLRATLFEYFDAGVPDGVIGDWVVSILPGSTRAMLAAYAEDGETIETRVAMLHSVLADAHDVDPDELERIIGKHALAQHVASAMIADPPHRDGSAFSAMTSVPAPVASRLLTEALPTSVTSPPPDLDPDPFRAPLMLDAIREALAHRMQDPTASFTSAFRFVGASPSPSVRSLAAELGL